MLLGFVKLARDLGFWPEWCGDNYLTTCLESPQYVKSLGYMQH